MTSFFSVNNYDEEKKQISADHEHVFGFGFASRGFVPISAGQASCIAGILNIKMGNFENSTNLPFYLNFLFYSLPRQRSRVSCV